jgi:hypothetical protein
VHPPPAAPCGPLLVLFLLFVAGCDYNPQRPPDARIYDMTDSGVVESVEETDDELRVVLTRDEIVVLTDSFLLYGGGVEPGELLVLAISPGGADAYATLRVGPDGYHILGEPAVDDGSHILFLNGLRLPKTQEFDPGPIDDGAFPSAWERFCINTAGAVIGYGTGCP